MKRQLRIGALFLLTASLFYGFAARAQGEVQQERVSYALSLIDAGADGNATTQNGGPVTDASTHVRVKVTVSVPRTGDTYGAVPAYASPARLMFRKHNGATTAFDGTLTLTKDAPADGAYYPMPQADADGLLSIVDPRKLNLRAVTSTNPITNFNLTFGQAHDPARWEATYLTAPIEIQSALDADEQSSAALQMVRSLLLGEATYEWFVASRRGVGSVARISDIQDHGRNMSFLDTRLWTPIDPNENSNLDDDSKLSMGKYTSYYLSSMPFGNPDPNSTKPYYGWTIYHGAVGSNWNGYTGAQLLNVDVKDPARIESPLYLDGISSVTFEACASAIDADREATLVVQYSIDSGVTWLPNLDDTTAEGKAAIDQKTVKLTAAFQKHTVNFGSDLPEGSSARFRIVRTFQNADSGSANIFTCVVRNLIVRSAAPTASFSKLKVETTNSDCADPYANEDFRVGVEATKLTGTPRGYKAEIRLRRRAEGDSARAWYAAVAETPLTERGAQLMATLKPNVILTNQDGSLNVRENAFFTDKNGTLTGVLAGVYDVAVDCSVLGSFAAGRTEIDAREAIVQTLDGYDVEEEDEDGQKELVHRPYVLNVREQPAKVRSVFLRVMYRTGTTDKNYDLDTFDVELLASAQKANTWRVDLPKVLRMKEPTAVYAWGYEPPKGSTETAKFETGFLSFKICAVDRNGKETWYGQRGSLSASTRPAEIKVVPAIVETFAKASTEEDTNPIIIAAGTLPNSHLMVELNLANDEAPTANLSGSFWQDFNTWDVAESFVKTEFRENVTAATADFDCEVGEGALGDLTVLKGWIPDEGPLAATTAFKDELPVGRMSQRGQFAFTMPNMSSIAQNKFAQFGASSDEATAASLGATTSSAFSYSDYLQASATAEVVLRRSYFESGNVYRPDALFRLRGNGSTLSPRDDDAASIKLNGVGKVSFRLGLSLPYDINMIAQLVSKGNDMFACKGAGLSASVTLANPSRTCAPSGYSVSYYLLDNNSGAFYELRVSQVVKFFDAEKDKPQDVVVMELYKWVGGGATRLTLSNGEAYVEAGTQLSGSTYGLWLRGDGRIAMGVTTGLKESLTETARTADVQVTSNVATTTFNFALGSAECRPTFRYINYQTAANDSYNSRPISPDEVTASTPSLLGRGTWEAKADTTSAGRLQVERKTPQGNDVGKVKVVASGGGLQKEHEFYTVDMDKLCEVTVGVANATLTILPANRNCNVFIDDIAVSSWCGNDANRNGKDQVPDYTDEGFVANTGFAGVGVWVRPEQDFQLDVPATEYNGKQCLLMQRSRQNYANGAETTTDEIVHTGNAMALYMPYSNVGYGPVSFRYRIPQYDEYGNQGELPSVRVMLQFTDEASTRDYLGNNAIKEFRWKNASQPIELRNTNGAWSMVSITPKLDNKELIGTEGTLRLVMVISDDMKSSDDPYIYLDDVRVCDNREGTTASWSATNVRVSEAPVANLYWKDRLATAAAVPAEESFAEKSTLTRAMQLNDTVADEETEGVYATTVIESPLLEEGVGRISFSARLMNPQSKPVRLYIYATTDITEAMNGLQAVTYVDVPNTCYKTYDIDLSRCKNFLTPPAADGSLSNEGAGEPFSCQDIRRIVIKAFIEGDGVQNDPFNAPPSYGRVLIDQLAIANPVQPSIRVASVAFSNMPGESVPEEFDALSPRSQPVVNASMLRAMVHLDRAQLLKTETIRVFLTVDPHDALGTGGSSLMKYTDLYEYKDVLGGEVQADEDHPIYTWGQNVLSKWPLSSWFKRSEIEAAIREKLENNTTPTTEALLEGLSIKDNTIELTQSDKSQLYFYGDISKLVKVSENSLVRYNAWVVYQSEEGDMWHVAQITPDSYTEFPWYFPRSLNAELREKASEEAEAAGQEPMTDDFFSPYFWIYSYLPGEAFINEFNFDDQEDASASSSARFVELCAPVNTTFAGWRIEMTGDNAISSIIGAIDIDPNTPALAMPDVGVVPYQRKDATAAQRGFYTAFNSASKVYYRDGSDKKTNFEPTANGGVVDRNFRWQELGLRSYAASVRLHRPTGGAEHIVCFSLNRENNVSTTTSQRNLTNLYEDYRTAYVEKGFGSEWFQTFSASTWEDYVADTTTAPDAFGKLGTLKGSDDPVQAQVKMHARRLVKADVFPANPDKDNRFSVSSEETKYVNDYANSEYANSIATVDMGGIFVTRKNAIKEDVDNGPLDLTDLMIGPWRAEVNPTKQTRMTEPTGGKKDLDPVVQVTPCQVNPDQYLVIYSGFASSTVKSELSGNYGSHTIDSYDEKGSYLRTNAAGRLTPQTWGLSQDVETVKLSYKAFPFHKVTSVSFRLRDASDVEAVLTDAEELKTLLTLSTGTIDYTMAAANEGWMTVDFATVVTDVALRAKVIGVENSATGERVRYAVEAKAMFALDPTNVDARKVITSVSPYCGTGSAEFPMTGFAQYQPWWGNSFGFEVRYDDATLQGAAALDGVVITYPSPDALAHAGGLGAGLKSAWTGYAFETTDPADPSVKRTVSLEGMEYANAQMLLNDVLMPNAGTRYATLGRGVQGVIADASVIATLGDTYARKMGYDGTAATADKKEPAIPFCVWGIYTVTLSTDRGNEKVSFLMRQAMPTEVTEVANVWKQPSHYASMDNLNAGKAAEDQIPYFYLYSTPPQSAWLNEVNRVQGDADEAPFVEVVFPILRGGILNDKVAQADPAGWTVRRYNADGTKNDAWTANLGDAAESPTGSTSYKYLTAATLDDSDGVMAYVLHRPCGVAEGGVWIGKDATGGTQTTVNPFTVTTNKWLMRAEAAYVVSGQTDARDVAGSVQLTGECESRDGTWVISSDIFKRTEWTFHTATKGTDNGDGIRPDTKPVWNLVTVTSVLKNTVYSGSPSGFQLVPGYFAVEGATGSSNTEVKTMGGSEWIYNGMTDGVVLSYRPRATYRFESITIPTELIGKVMLIGNEGTLTPDVVQTRVRELKMRDPSQWLTLNGRAKVEMHPVTGEPTGKIIFNVDFEERTDEKGNIVTFGSLDSYVISLVFTEELPSAQNTIEVAFGQGEVKLGAWMVTQSLFALNEDGTPNLEKGGDAALVPIWSDEEGSITLDENGDVVIDDETGLPARKYANVHGWTYQPIVGDNIGMAAVINPDLGLQGGSLTNPVAMLTKENASLRPFLVWTAIPKSRIPDNLFNASLPTGSGVPRSDFIRGWGLNAWIGSPSVLDGATMSLNTLRQNLRAGAASTASSAMYAAAGIIPMAYQGYCGEDERLSTAPATENSTAKQNLLSFRTMTATELADALTAGEMTGLTTAGTLDTDTNPLLPFTTSVDLSNPEIWQDGAILRFAVIIADAVKGTVYDCQSISNFSSKTLDVYCPWYVPDAITNVNRATSATDAGGGVSPFAWVYSIPQGGVWINEFRPFAVTTTAGARVASAFELAMYASPVVEDVSDINNLPATFTPTRTLDGWKVITRYAPLPPLGADPTLPIEWTTHKEVPLHSWVPRRRIMKSLATSMGDWNLYANADYSLDYYTALAVVDPTDTSVVKSSLAIDEEAYNAAYYKDLSENIYASTFQWMNFNLTNDARRDDADLFNANLQEKLTSDVDGPYAGGVVYSIALVRNNGVIEDSVIFYKESPYGGYDSIGSYLEDRLDIVIKSEEANRASAGAIRALTASPLPNTTYPQLPAQFLRFTNENTQDTELGWYIAYSQNRVNSTFSMPNEMEVGFAGLSYTQPYLVYTPNVTSFAAIEVHVTGGGGATLALNANGHTETGRDLAISALKATGYELNLQNWNQAWYAPPTITRDSKPFTPVSGYSVVTTYASNGKRTSSVLIDSGLVSEDTLYNVVFNYTAEAQALNLPKNVTPNFMKWLQQVTPNEVVKTPGVDLDEAFWIGAKTPTEVVDPKLKFGFIDFYIEDVEESASPVTSYAATANSAETKPMQPIVNVQLTNAGQLVTSLEEGGNVVLFGRRTLAEKETFWKVLTPEDLAADATIILTTDCKFFQVKLLSDEEVEALSTSSTTSTR